MVCARWNCQPRHCWPPEWPTPLRQSRALLLLRLHPRPHGRGHLFRDLFGSAGDEDEHRRPPSFLLEGRSAPWPPSLTLLHSSLSASRCGDLALTPPDLFGQVFLHQEGLAFITSLIFRACEIVDLGTLPVARWLAGW